VSQSQKQTGHIKQMAFKDRYDCNINEKSLCTALFSLRKIMVADTLNNE
jgi:hypothetical protein